MSAFGVYTGVLTYGGFGIGARDAAIITPVYSDDTGFCSDDVIMRKQFRPDTSHCNGCSISDPASWDLQSFKLFDVNKDYVTITWDSGEGWYKATDMDGNDAGWCEWLEPGSSDDCDVGIDNYSYAHYMDCDITVGMSFS